jgi:hypothetical protein
MIKVKMQAPMVPTGMAKLGFFKSPDMLAPAIIPVTPLNKTENITIKSVDMPFE